MSTNVGDLDVLNLHTSLETHVSESSLNLALLLFTLGLLRSRNGTSDVDRVFRRSSPSDGRRNVGSVDLDHSIVVSTFI